MPVVRSQLRPVQAGLDGSSLASITSCPRGRRARASVRLNRILVCSRWRASLSPPSIPFLHSFPLAWHQGAHTRKGARTPLTLPGVRGRTQPAPCPHSPAPVRVSFTHECARIKCTRTYLQTHEHARAHDSGHVPQPNKHSHIQGRALTQARTPAHPRRSAPARAWARARHQTPPPPPPPEFVPSRVVSC